MYLSYFSWHSNSIISHWLGSLSSCLSFQFPHSRYKTLFTYFDVFSFYRPVIYIVLAQEVLNVFNSWTYYILVGFSGSSGLVKLALSIYFLVLLQGSNNNICFSSHRVLHTIFRCNTFHISTAWKIVIQSFICICFKLTIP